MLKAGSETTNSNTPTTAVLEEKSLMNGGGGGSDCERGLLHLYNMEDIFNSDEDEEEADFEPERDFTEITDRIRKESDKKRRRLTGIS